MPKVRASKGARQTVVPVATSNRYHLSGGGITVTYLPIGPGGLPHFT